MIVGSAIVYFLKLPVETIGTPIADPSWQFDIAPVLGETCATSGACHAGPTPALGLNLEPGLSYASVVNVPSQARPAFLRVKPGDADSSFLYLATSPIVAERQMNPHDPRSRAAGPASSPGGLTGIIKFADIQFRGVGASGSCSDLHVELTELRDPDGADLRPVQTTDGRICVS